MVYSPRCQRSRVMSGDNVIQLINQFSKFITVDIHANPAHIESLDIGGISFGQE
ncbi:hypothetical protein GA0061070_101816 [Kosakonia oryziphila]|uniref:Uncharacterized protein n=1 Tax=Kosakonia oryziphila TaxID=1005667 RepID=A0A1C4DRF2_9ENTR|nr:hypothetical protein GA0061070_101816 [Kosakonia oryziphila]